MVLEAATHWASPPGWLWDARIEACMGSEPHSSSNSDSSSLVQVASGGSTLVSHWKVWNPFPKQCCCADFRLLILLGCKPVGAVRLPKRQDCQDPHWCFSSLHLQKADLPFFNCTSWVSDAGIFHPSYYAVISEAYKILISLLLIPSILQGSLTSICSFTPVVLAFLCGATGECWVHLVTLKSPNQLR